jgi:FlaA1/EpsC-like NDP-sugar epimerase
LLLVFLLGVTKFGYRTVSNSVRGRKGKREVGRSLIVGAGDAGEAVVRSLRYGNESGRVAVGFLDDDPVKAGLRIHGVAVLGRISELPGVIRRERVDEVILAIPSATRVLKRQVFAACSETQVRVKTVPNINDVLMGKRQLSELSDLDAEELLGRPRISTDVEKASSYLRGKRVVVTGAGGSIGGEICKQVAEYGPESLLLLGKGENSLHDVRLQLAAKGCGGMVRCVLGSVTNKPKVRGVFEGFRPEVIFHAAAHKHVYLTEANCDEAVLNNILGTRNILEVSEEVGAERVVVISTDKAADPTSVMGCTKRIVEMLVSSRKETGTVVVGVRFCNVLESKGSVIPTFRRQIELGGPVTVTDERMKRYFMTIPEAVELVIQAGAIGQHGEVLMLAMGEAVKIVDLAKQMIRLSGYVEGEDIAIAFTGARAGEKLEEELVGRRERLVKTEHPKVRRIEFADGGPDGEALDREIDSLVEKSIMMEMEEVRWKLREMVPEYDPGGKRRKEGERAGAKE